MMHIYGLRLLIRAYDQVRVSNFFFFLATTLKCFRVESRPGILVASLT